MVMFFINSAAVGNESHAGFSAKFSLLCMQRRGSKADFNAVIYL